MIEGPRKNKGFIGLPDEPMWSKREQEPRPKNEKPGEEKPLKPDNAGQTSGNLEETLETLRRIKEEAPKKRESWAAEEMARFEAESPERNAEFLRKVDEETKRRKSERDK